jgi:hypothetical protein
MTKRMSQYSDNGLRDTEILAVAVVTVGDSEQGNRTSGLNFAREWAKVGFLR